MKRLLIIGAGGFGREILSWVLDIEPAQQIWKFEGFLDENPDALSGVPCTYPIIGAPSTYLPADEDVFICAIAHPKTKLSVCRMLVDRGGEFINLMHPSAHIGRDNRIGYGCICCGRTSITTNVTVGNFVTINGYTGVGHDAVIGDGVTLSAHCDIAGNAVLSEGVFLGSHAVIMPGAKVGDYAIVGAGSVVLKKVKPGATVMGVPAKQVAGF